jgi:hypothetical protein
MTTQIHQVGSPPTKFEIVAVACHLNGWGGTHVGFLYDRHEDGTRWFCDVAWDLVCRNEEVTKTDLVWVNVRLREENLRLLAAALDLMDQNAASIPYDTRFGPAVYFDPHSWVYIKDNPGLTCSTFIIAVLRSLGFELLDTLDWESRAEDGPALDHLIAELERRRVDRSRIEAMRANNDNRRFRPEEVCAAAGLKQWPVEFARAEPAGIEVAFEVNRRNNELARAARSPP